MTVLPLHRLILLVLPTIFVPIDVAAYFVEIRSSVVKIFRDHDSAETLKDLLKMDDDGELALLKDYTDLDKSLPPDGACECVHKDCGCCLNLDIKRIKLHDKACINISYIPDQLAISLTVTIGNKVVYNETISAHDPPDICFAVPGLKKYAKLCLKFYNLEADAHKFHGCVKLEAKIYHIKVEDIDFGCFDIKLLYSPLIPLLNAKNDLYQVLVV